MQVFYTSILKNIPFFIWFKHFIQLNFLVLFEKVIFLVFSVHNINVFLSPLFSNLYLNKRCFNTLRLIIQPDIYYSLIKFTLWI